jgi:hypothetical protein
LRIRHKGYEDNVQTVTVNNSMWTTRNVELQPLPEATLNGEFTFDGQPQTVNITARHVMGDEVFTVPAQENQYELDWWEGEIELLFHAPGYASKFIQLDLAAGSNELNVNFEEEVLLFSESWGDDFSQWNVDGGWYIGIEDEFGIPCAKDNPNRYYTNGSEAVLEIDRVFNFNGASDLSLQFFNKYHTEHGYDLCQVEARIGGSENWNIIASYSGVSAREGVSAWQL